MRIDVHTHLTSRIYLSTILDLGGFDELSTFNIMRKLYEQRLSPEALSTDETLEPRVAEMASGGVDLQVLSLGAAQPYFEAEHKAVTTGGSLPFFAQRYDAGLLQEAIDAAATRNG